MPWLLCENGTEPFFPWLDKVSVDNTRHGRGKRRWKMADGKIYVTRVFARKDGFRGNLSSVGKTRDYCGDLISQFTK